MNQIIKDRTMKIYFYHSNLCPRCRQADRFLKKNIVDYPDLKIEKIDILKHPLKALKNNNILIPSFIASTGQKVSFFIPTAQKIEAFLKTLPKKP